MVRCSKCATEIDNSKLTHCPFCNSPLPAANKQAGGPPPYPFSQPQPLAAPPQPKPPVLNPQVPPPPPQPGFYTPPPQPPTNAAPLFGSPLPAARPGSTPARPTSAPASRGSRYTHTDGKLKWGAIASACLMILYYSVRVGARLVSYNHGNAGASNGGYSASASGLDENPYLSKLNTPESATEAVMEALQTQNWRTFYFVSAFWPDAARTNADANVLATEMQMLLSTSTNGRDFQAVMRAMHDIRVTGGGAGGDRCNVAVSAGTSFMGHALKLSGTAHLIKLSGHWYLNLVEENGRTTSSAFSDLAGLSNLRSESGTLLFPQGGSFFRPGIQSMGPRGIVGQQPGFQQAPQGGPGDTQGSVPPGMNFPRGNMPGQGDMPMGRIQQPGNMMQGNPQNNMPGMGMQGQPPGFPGGPMGPHLMPGQRFGPFTGSPGSGVPGSPGASESTQPPPQEGQQSGQQPENGGQPDRRGGF